MEKNAAGNFSCNGHFSVTEFVIVVEFVDGTAEKCSKEFLIHVVSSDCVNIPNTFTCIHKFHLKAVQNEIAMKIHMLFSRGRVIVTLLWEQEATDTFGQHEQSN